jgi:RNA polymerase sporulation-specific sigma factor
VGEKGMFALLRLVLENVLFMALHIENNVKFPKPYEPEEEAEAFAKLADASLSHQEYIKVRNDIIMHNMRLVGLIAKRYYTSDVDAETLHECGYFALLKAASTYNAGKNTRFATYATKCIANEMLMQIRVKTKQQRETSTDEPIEEDKDGNKQTLEDKLSSNCDIVEEIDIDIKSRQLKIFMEEELSTREREIIFMRYGIGGRKEETQREIAERLGISRSYVSRIEKKCLSKLQKRFENAKWLDGIKK